MSREKRSSASPAQPESTDAVDGCSPALRPPKNERFSVRVECERALAVFRLGFTGKAQRIINVAISNYEGVLDPGGMAFLHRLQGMFYSSLASKSGDSDERLKHLTSMAESARRATELSPNSLEFAHFLSFSLFELERNRDSKEYEKVIQECKRGLSIKNPADPFEDYLRIKRTDWGHLTPELRIQVLRDKINWLLQQSARQRINLPQRNPTFDDLSPVLEKEIAERAPKSENKMKIGLTKKHQRKAEISEREPEKKMERIRSFWGSMSVEKKKAFMSVRIEELKPYIESVEGKKIFEEAINFATKKNRWEFWECGACGETFLVFESYKLHFAKEHVKDLEPTLEGVVPDEADRLRTDMIMSYHWKPLDRTATLKIIENEQRFEPFDAKKSSPNLINTEAVSNWPNEESTQEDSVSKVPENWLSMNWPIIKDHAREEHLQKLQSLFQLFLKRKCLSSLLVEHATNFAFEKLKSHVSESKLAGYGLKGSPGCFSFLDVDSLKHLLHFMEANAAESGVNTYTEEAEDDAGIVENIYFDSDLSCLILDERLLHAEINTSVCDDDELSAVAIAMVDLADDLPHKSAFISWLFEDPMMGEQSVLQNLLHEHKKGLQMACIKTLEKQCDNLESACKDKWDIMECQAALLKLQRAFKIIADLRKQLSEFELRIYAPLLKERHAKLLEMNLQTISSLEKALSKAIPDALAYDKEGKKIQEGFEQADDCIEQRVKHLQNASGFNRTIVDTKVLMIRGAIGRLQRKLARLSTYDYRLFVMQLMKLYMREKLESLVDEDTIKRADAVREAFLAELEDESAKNGNKPEGSGRQTCGKLKDAEVKRKKDHRKGKDPKATNASKSPVHHESAEPKSAVTYEWDPKTSTVVVYANEVESELQIEETLVQNEDFKHEGKGKCPTDINKIDGETSEDGVPR